MGRRGADWVTAGLLGVIAPLFVIASFLTLLTTANSSDTSVGHVDFEVQSQPWKINFTAHVGSNPQQSHGQVLGIGFLLAAVVAVSVAGLLLAGLGRRSRRVRGSGVAAAGLATGVSLSTVFDVSMQVLLEKEGVRSTLGPGFLVLGLTLLLSLVALASASVALRASPSVPAPPLNHHERPVTARSSGIDVTVGVLSIFLSVVLTTGSCLELLSGSETTMWWSGDRTQPGGVPLAFSVITAVIAAIVLFTGRTRLGRTLGSVAAALGFAASLTVVLKVVNVQLVNHSSIGLFGPGFWVLSVGGVFALVVLVLTVLAKPTSPRAAHPYGAAPQPNPQWMQQGGYTPGMPQPAGFTPPPGGFAQGGPAYGGVPPQGWGAPPQQGWSTPPPQGPATEDRR